MSKMQLLRFMVFGLSVLFTSFSAITSYAMADQKPAEKAEQTQGHAKKEGSGVSHFVVDQKEQAAKEGDLSEGKGHGTKTGDAEHFDQGEAAKESAESGETMESHPHSHKAGEGAEHYEPNK